MSRSIRRFRIRRRSGRCRPRRRRRRRADAVRGGGAARLPAAAAAPAAAPVQRCSQRRRRQRRLRRRRRRGGGAARAVAAGRRRRRRAGGGGGSARGGGGAAQAAPAQTALRCHRLDASHADGRRSGRRRRAGRRRHARATLRKIERVEPIRGKVEGSGPVFAFSHNSNAALEAVNDILAAGGTVSFAKTESTIYASGAAAALLQKDGVDATSLKEAPGGLAGEEAAPRRSTNRGAATSTRAGRAGSWSSSTSPSPALHNSDIQAGHLRDHYRHHRLRRGRHAADHGRHGARQRARPVCRRHRRDRRRRAARFRHRRAARWWPWGTPACSPSMSSTCR